MVRAPRDERPVGTVPKAAQQEDDERVAHHLRLAHTATAQGDIDVVAEPSRQRDVPTTPELGNVAAEIRHVEVPHQPDAEQLGRADGNVAVAREVAVNLEGEEDGGKEQRASGLLRVGRKHLVDIDSTIVGHHDILEQAPQYLSHAINSGVVVELALLEELRQEVGRPFDGSGHQLREERDEGEEGDDVLRRLNLATIHVDAVTEGLESVERDAYGKYHLQQQPVRGDVEQLRELGDEEVVVLENGQYQQVQDDVGCGDEFPFAL